ncbi:hypothetical protein CEXT_789891 [Caerostris extrusa]|uniref:Uncharacterized protein n=1 Tax=Caerostris extrusa TaxID=172846 RepID=A0AAV4SV13_CAEEX|nr:hypothetical protein CEXT_789891 [Caerostris extrusa]
MLHVLKTSAFARPSPVTAIEVGASSSVVSPIVFILLEGGGMGCIPILIPKSARKDAGERRRELQEHRDEERERWGSGSIISVSPICILPPNIPPTTPSLPTSPSIIDKWGVGAMPRHLHRTRGQEKGLPPLLLLSPPSRWGVL